MPHKHACTKHCMASRSCTQSKAWATKAQHTAVCSMYPLSVLSEEHSIRPNTGHPKGETETSSSRSNLKTKSFARGITVMHVVLVHRHTCGIAQ